MRSARTRRPSADLTSTRALRLPRLAGRPKSTETRGSYFGDAGSSLTTSAPKRASIPPMMGPAMTLERSRTRVPRSQRPHGSHALAARARVRRRCARLGSTAGGCSQAAGPACRTTRPSSHECFTTSPASVAWLEWSHSRVVRTTAPGILASAKMRSHALASRRRKARAQCSLIVCIQYVSVSGKVPKIHRDSHSSLWRHTSPLGRPRLTRASHTPNALKQRS